MYVVIWEFRVRENSREQFEKEYGPQGAWAQFFRRDEGYLGTELLRDAEVAGRYLTIDRWTSPSAHEVFKRQQHAEYEAIDRRCESLTEHEARIGAFDHLGR